MTPSTAAATTAIALKEWAAVCAALSAGRQIILLRKGGIAEGPQGFQAEHGEFWLLPTYFHERPEALKAEDRGFFDSLPAAPPLDRVRIDLFARVRAVIHLDRPELLARVASQHVYGERTVRDRFFYRRPGLWLLAVQVYRGAAEELAVWPELAGCHSWVELPRSLPAADLSSVLSDEGFTTRLERLRSALAGETSETSRRVDAGPPAFDVLGTLAQLAGDEQLATALVAAYRRDHDSWMSRASEALVRNDREDLVLAAHRLAGLLANFAGAPASGIARQLEQAARRSDLAAARQALSLLRSELTRLDRALEAWPLAR